MSTFLLEGWWAWLLPGALQATPLLLAAAGLDLVMPRFAAPRWRALLWSFAALKLLAPLPRFWSLGVLPAYSEPAPWIAYGLPALWLTVVTLLTAGGAVWLHRESRRWRNAAITAPGPLLETTARLSEAFGVPAPRLVVTPLLDGPLVTGLRRPVLYWPAGLEAELSAVECEQVLRHELTHLQRRDHWRAAAWSLLTVVFWFHPLVWWAAHRMRAVREECCDRTAEALPAHSPESYRAALLLVLARSMGAEVRPLRLALVDPRAPLSHRLSMLSAPPQSLLRRGAAGACVIAIILAWPVCGWAQQRADETAEWIARPPGSLQLRYLVLERLAALKP